MKPVPLTTVLATDPLSGRHPRAAVGDKRDAQVAVTLWHLATWWPHFTDVRRDAYRETLTKIAASAPSLLCADAIAVLDSRVNRAAFTPRPDAPTYRLTEIHEIISRGSVDVARARDVLLRVLRRSRSRPSLLALADEIESRASA